MNQDRTGGGALGPSSLDRIAARLQSFRQGEVVDLPWLVHAAASHGLPWVPAPLFGILRNVARSKVRQVVVLTQTCDIVRPPDKRPYLQVAALIRVRDANTAKRYAEGETPQYVAVPEVGTDVFADLDRIMTLDKRLIADCPHHAGVATDPEEVRRFGQAVARKFGRYPFPNYFIQSVEPLRSRVLRRWDKSDSPEGKVLADLVQIRVQPVPVEPSSDTDLTLVFIMRQGSLPILADPPAPGTAIITWLATHKQASEIATKLAETAIGPDDRAHLYSKLAEAWAALCRPNSAIRSVSGEIVSEDEYVLSDYWQSERLDLDQLSGPVTSG
jgi:hypothetical protein